MKKSYKCGRCTGENPKGGSMEKTRLRGKECGERAGEGARTAGSLGARGLLFQVSITITLLRSQQRICKHA